MAVFSDTDIRENIGRSIEIADFDPSLLNPDSYDGAVGDVWKVEDETLKHEILEIYRLLGSRGLHTDYRIPDFSPRQLKKAGILKPGRVYIGELRSEISAGEGIAARIVPRSGMARDGVHAFNPSADSRNIVAIVAYTYAALPEDPVAQIIFYEDGTRPLTAQQMQELYDRNELFFSAPRFIDEKGNDYVSLKFDKDLKPYMGGELTDGDNSDRFSSAGRSRFGFYLAITRESFGTGNSSVLWMFSAHGGHIYPNAPLVHANVSEQRHTLEVSLTHNDAERINNRSPYACSISAYPLRTPAKQIYQGKYTGQESPRPKVSD